MTSACFHVGNLLAESTNSERSRQESWSFHLSCEYDELLAEEYVLQYQFGLAESQVQGSIEDHGYRVSSTGEDGV